jgi:hypothetical protein
MMVTLSVMAIVGSMGTMQITTVRRSLQGDGAMRLAMTQLNRAREMAITQRRNMEVQFVGNNWIRIVRNDVPSGTTVLANVAFESNAQSSPGSATRPTDSATAARSASAQGSRSCLRPTGH